VASNGLAREVGSRHGHCISTLTERLLPALVGRAIVRPQLPLFISSTTQPQPDVLLVKPGAHYWTQPPRPEDVLLLVEVSGTSYSSDRDIKLPLYAGENIPEVWIIDLVRGAVEAYREPSARHYQSLLRLERGATLAPAASPDVTIAVTDVLPPA
jgi:Uma2 family endonuclease